jgi:predicted permease
MTLVRRLRAVFRRRQMAEELDEEMRLHLELRRRRLERDGAAGDAAQEAARRRFGNRLRLREDAMEAWSWIRLEQLGQDLRFGARALIKSPGFAAVTILTLALATGASTAIFSVVNGVILRPLPFRDPDALVQVYGRNWREDRGGEPDPMTGLLAAPEQAAFARSRSLEGLAAYYVNTVLLRGTSGVERLNAAIVDADTFGLLGVDAVVGRTFRADDPMDVAVVSERLWRERFGRDSSIAGTIATIDDRPVTIVGVMPSTFQFPYRAASLLPGTQPESRTDVWLPLPPRGDAAGASPRRGRLHAVARLAPGVSLERATAELGVIAAQVEAEYRTNPRASRVRVGVRLQPLSDSVVGQVRRSLWMLFAAVGLVLAAACVNVANLLLARMSARRTEVATRAAIGAGPVRIARQFLTESLLLGLAGGAAGAAIAWWGTTLLMTIGASRIPRAHEITYDWRVFAFLLLACVATAIVFGLAPALAAARMDVAGVVKADTRASSGPAHRRLRDALVVVQVALAFVLAMGAAILVAELRRLERLDPGLQTENVVTLHVTPRVPAGTYYAIEERVRRLPGVLAAGLTQLLPLQNWGWEADFAVEGGPPDPSRPRAELRYVTPGYFSALGIPLVRGRFFTSSDRPGAPAVILINETLARRYFRDVDPVGRALDRGTIIGVVGDVRHAGLDRDAGPEIYYPAAQNLATVSDIGMSLVVRTGTPSRTLVDAVRAAVTSVDPNLAIFNVKTMEQVVEESLWQLNLYRWLVGLFAAIALALTAIGLFGVASYAAASRAREFAIRLALGSSTRRLARLVLDRAVLLTVAGVASGAVLLPLVFRGLRALSIVDAPPFAAFAATALVIVLIAIGACAWPAFRATRLDPVSALRQQ